MGCGSSTSAQSPSGDDQDFAAEMRAQRMRFDKGTGRATAGEGREKPETDFFDAMDAGQGE